MGTKVSDSPRGGSEVAVPDYLRKAQEGLSSDYESRLISLTIKIRTTSAADAAALYEAYLDDLMQRKTAATARIVETTPTHLEINRFEIGLIEAQERQIAKDISASSTVATYISKNQLTETSPLFAEEEEPENFRSWPDLGIDVKYHDGENPPQTAFTFVIKDGGNESTPQRPSLAGAVSSVPPLPIYGTPRSYDDFTLDVPVPAMEGELIPAAAPSSGKTSLSLVVSPHRTGVGIGNIDIEHIEMKPTHHGMEDHRAEVATNGTRRWTPEQLADDEARVRDALGRLTGQNLGIFLAQVLVPLQKEVLTELARRKEANSSFPATTLATLNASLLDHADRLRRFVRAAQNTLRNTPSAPTSAINDEENSPPSSPPPSSGEGQGRASSPVMARRSRPTEEKWTLAKMLKRGNILREAVTDTVHFARSVKNPTSLTELLTDELRPEQADVERELDRRREAYGSEFNQAIFAEREFHLLEHAKVMSQLVSSVQEEVTSLETVAAPSHSSAHHPSSIPTIAEMLDMRNSIRYNLLEGGTATQFINHALSGVERALAAEPNNAFYKDEMKQLLAFQAEDRRRQELENLRTEEIRAAAAEKEAAATPPSFRERLTSVFSRARSSLTDSFTRATNAFWNPFGQISATVARFASVAALGISLKGADGSSSSHLEEKLSQPSVAEVPAESNPPLNELFSTTSQRLRDTLSALRAARPSQEDSYARRSEERTHEPG